MVDIEQPKILLVRQIWLNGPQLDEHGHGKGSNIEVSGSLGNPVVVRNDIPLTGVESALIALASFSDSIVLDSQLVLEHEIALSPDARIWYEHIIFNNV